MVSESVCSPVASMNDLKDAGVLQLVGESNVCQNLRQVARLLRGEAAAPALDQPKG